MENDNLTKEQWMAIAEKLADYLYANCMRVDCEYCKFDLPCKCSGVPRWIDYAKKELGYETTK